MTLTAVETTSTFPVPLVCPACQRPFEGEGVCPCPSGHRLGAHEGIQRTLFGQNYWGECSREKMHAILAAMDHVHWKEALRQEVPDEPVRHHLTSEIGADFLYAMPWDRVRTVLDIGAGMGFLAAPMSRFAEHLVALEAVPERAQFLARRAEQDGLRNLHPVIASGTELPFRPGSFDMVTMNGVFEYIGLWGEGDPQRLQEEFLARIVRLLKPGGFFYVGIETRYALGAFLGSRDHSGLRFTSLMPRWLADRYCRWRSVPFYGSEHVRAGYRTYTYTPRQYEQMFRRAGFQSVGVYGVSSGYNRQDAIYPMNDASARKTILAIADPASSFLGRMRRAVANSSLLYQTLEPEVVVFGCKAPDAGRLAWGGIEWSGTITQLNTARKVQLILFEGGRPRFVAKACKYELDCDRLERKNKFLERAEQALGKETLAVRWARPAGRQSWHKLRFCLFEFVPGPTLSRLLITSADPAQALRGHVQRLVDGYVDLTERLTQKLGQNASDAEREAFIESLAQIRVDHAPSQELIDAGCEAFRRRAWPLKVVHGDLSLGNTLVRDDGQLVLIDWENVAEAGLVAIDLIRLMSDGWLESQHLGAAQRQAFLTELRAVVRQGLAAVGVEPSEYPAVAGLYLAHQVQFNRSRETEEETYVEAFKAGAWKLD